MLSSGVWAREMGGINSSWPYWWKLKLDFPSLPDMQSPTSSCYWHLVFSPCRGSLLTPCFTPVKCPGTFNGCDNKLLVRYRSQSRILADSVIANLTHCFLSAHQKLQGTVAGSRQMAGGYLLDTAQSNQNQSCQAVSISWWGLLSLGPAHQEHPECRYARHRTFCLMPFCYGPRCKTS